MENKKVITAVVTITAILVVILFMASMKSGNEEVVSTTGMFDLNVDENFVKSDYIGQGYPALLDVGGAECEPCKAMAPVLEKLNEDLQDKAIIKFVDYWKYPDLANQFQFTSIPTQFFYDEEGNLVETHEGMITEEEALAIFADMGYEF